MTDGVPSTEQKTRQAFEQKSRARAKSAAPEPVDKPDKRAHFVTVVTRRARTALTAINTIGKMGGNKSAYDYGPGDVEQVIGALKEAIAEAEKRLTRAPRQIKLFELGGRANGG